MVDFILFVFVAGTFAAGFWCGKKFGQRQGHDGARDRNGQRLAVRGWALVAAALIATLAAVWLQLAWWAATISVWQMP